METCSILSPRCHLALLPHKTNQSSKQPKHPKSWGSLVVACTAQLRWHELKQRWVWRLDVCVAFTKQPGSQWEKRRYRTWLERPCLEDEGNEWTFSEWKILWSPCFLKLSDANNLHVWDIVKHTVIVTQHIATWSLQAACNSSSGLCQPLQSYKGVLSYTFGDSGMWRVSAPLCSVWLFFLLSSQQYPSASLDLLFSTNSSAWWLSWGKLCIWSTALF